MCVTVYGCAHMNEVPRGQRQRLPWNWGLNLGPLQEQRMLLTAESSLQPKPLNDHFIAKSQVRHGDAQQVS